MCIRDRFGDIIRKLPDSFVEIETDDENNVYINCLNSKFKIKGDSPEEYPVLPDVSEENLYNVPQDILKNMIKQTVFAISQDQTKPVLMGELLEIVNGDVSLVAIDGYRPVSYTHLIFSTISSVSLIPAVSTIFRGIPFILTNSSITSLVVPAISVTIALFSPNI